MHELASDFQALKSKLHDDGLFTPSRAYYARLVAVIASCAIVAICILLLHIPPWMKLADAGLFAFVCVQIGLIGHDIAHGQIFHGGIMRPTMSILCWSLGLGVSADWWTKKHHRHHAYPNVVGKDPDITFPVVIFAPEQVAHKRGWQRFIVNRQAWFYFPLTALILINWRFITAIHLSRHRFPRRKLEMCCVALHFTIYTGLLCSILPFIYALIFMLTHHMIGGVYMAMIFGPNHKGLEVIKSDASIDPIVHQIITARDVREDRFGIVRLFYGGLQWQIAHHLFPAMPRHHLAVVAPAIRELCRAHNVSYTSANIRYSLKAIIAFLHKISVEVRHA